jgi:para-aminobenzoate synthetase component I
MLARRLLLTRQKTEQHKDEWKLIVETEEKKSGELEFGYIRYPETKKKTEINLFKGELIHADTAPEKFNSFFPSESNQKIRIINFPDKNIYLDNVKKLKHYIQLGDIYEINYCVQFTAEKVEINPYQLFLKLNSISDAPHACLAKFDNDWIICSSPERFIKRSGNKLITQPIKGTARRSSNAIEDEQFKSELKDSLKEKTENVMIVDVARNDLSRIAEKGSVQVEELFGVYTYRQVHQMVSTISSKIIPETSFKEIIKATFPMASMTGAPKIKAMQLIDEFENFKRNFYSGSIGFIDNTGDFDFNVVIRSLIYNEQNNTISFAVGSAITALCDPEKEWEECLIKADALIKLLK